MAFDVFGGLFKGGGGIMGIAGTIFWVILIGIPTLVFIFFIFYMIYKKRLWNLDVEFKLPRSDGRLINAELGKGYYNVKQGVVFVKRKKKRKSPMEPFDVKKYLQGNRILTVVQVGADEYRPILNESWTEMEDIEPVRDKDGKIIKGKDGKPLHEKAGLLKIMVDNSRSRAWRNSFERDAKATYSILNLLREYAIYIGIGFIIICNFVGFAILWTKVS